MYAVTWEVEDGVEFHLGHGAWIDVLRGAGLEVERLVELYAPDDAETHAFYDTATAGLGAQVAERRPVGGAQDRLILASTSPQRKAILEQLRIPFEVVPPRYVEDDPPDADPVELVRRHAEGKARSVHADGLVTLGVDTTVVLDGRVYGKAADRDDARRMLS